MLTSELSADTQAILAVSAVGHGLVLVFVVALFIASIGRR